MRFLRISLVLLVAFLVAPAPVWSGVQAPEKTPETEKKAADIYATKIAITPHRAIYNMALASARNGSNMRGVSGRMMFEWRDVCDGWAVQQHMRLNFVYAEGEEAEMASTQLTWESKDGKQYNFNIRRVSDGKETERFVGKAQLDDKGGIVHYTAPQVKDVKLPPDTLFPSAHTTLILKRATAGDKLFSRRVFDGSDEEGSNDVSAFVGPSEAKWQEAELSPKLKSNTLLSQPDWPIRLAFFKLTTETGEPDYEMNLDILSNGIVRKMTIDYGDFVVNGTLSEIEPLPASGCAE